MTFEVGAGDARCFVTWSRTESGIDLTAETRRMRRAIALTRVPQDVGVRRG